MQPPFYYPHQLVSPGILHIMFGPNKIPEGWGISTLRTTPPLNQHVIISKLAGLSLSFEAAVACKLSPVAVKYVSSGHVSKAQKGLSI